MRELKEFVACWTAFGRNERSNNKGPVAELGERLRADPPNLAHGDGQNSEVWLFGLGTFLRTVLGEATSHHVASGFVRAPITSVQPLLESLAALGQTDDLGHGRFAAKP